MDLLGFAVIALGLLGYALVSGRLAESVVTPSLVFVAFGLALGPAGLGLLRLDVSHGAIGVLAEATLVLVLFADAARIDLRDLRRNHNLPARMLIWGMPLTVAAGTAAGVVLFAGLGFWEAALLAAVLTPTDAALGQALIASPRVPVRIRQTVNVESGLNDGIALPVVLVLATCAAAAHAPEDVARWVAFGAKQLTLGPLAGVVAGHVGGRLIDAAARHGWMTETFEGLSALGIAALAFAGAELVDGNGFIAAFTAGLAFGHAVRHRCRFLLGFAEAEGQLLALATFLIFGAALLPEGLAHLSWDVLAYAALSLTVVRMVPISLSLAGAGLRAPTHVLIGWFGPRGIASILFALLIVERAAIPHRDEILAVTAMVVALSTLLHGLSAAPAARAYAALAARMGECAETAEVTEMPLRFGNRGTGKSPDPPAPAGPR